MGYKDRASCSVGRAAAVESKRASATDGAKSGSDMAEGPSLETYTNSPNSLNGSHAPGDVAATAAGGSGRGALVFLGLAIAGAAIAFTVIRGVTRKRPADPTTERIQALIDEANRLLKQLDEQKPG